MPKAKIDFTQDEMVLLVYFATTGMLYESVEGDLGEEELEAAAALMLKARKVVGLDLV